MMRLAGLMLVGVLIAASCAGTGEPPGTVDTATEAASAFLADTVAELFPTHTYAVDVEEPTSGLCMTFGGITDETRWATYQEFVIDVRPGDNPEAMALLVVREWERLGYDVESNGWGSGSVTGDTNVAGSTNTGKGYLPGFDAVDHDGVEFDVMVLSASTDCYLRP